ncbi:MAG: amino acid ABC transporter substrate-binding protein [Deltaproteobacteria bacterium]|nr:amino acid ABC transporter substrate-binding protein [Deltaproteobacteria bacterium]MBW1919013.1 amino acid ABC transporter substrate-binding protein [Deltaproteobacteria bacterium]MBW1934378.1 amino acid ABC transporter substrate-binding protein [Deltaproteobacteria bacterium]MBW1976522.1 amino acid ABC transporter substrate-binding protein [Deltaproteobacteria bacterium]MBW2043782.1 amino acid ABC transporter substrate-binding protein [Deltaproteobacteria bacterium]
MKRRLLIMSVGILVIVVLTMLSFVPAYAQAEVPKTIKIGILVSFTGPDAMIGKPAEIGYEMAVEKINKGGGVYVKEYGKKIPLELLIMDMETNPEKAVARAEVLNQRKASVVCGTTLMSATSDIFEKNKLPAITSLVTNVGLFERGFKYYFGISKMNDGIVDAIFAAFANIPKDQRPSRWAVWEEQSDWIAELFNLARKKAPANGVTFVSHSKYPMLARDMSPLIFAAKKAGAEVIFSAPVPPDCIMMLRQMRELGYNPKGIIMIRGSDDPAWAKMTGPMGDYVIGCPDWHPALSCPGVKELNAEYKAKFGKRTHIVVGNAYASIQIAAAAIEKAGTLERSKIRDAIAGIDTMTVFGRIKFNNKGRRIDAPPVVTQWQKGVMEMVWPNDMKTKKLVYPIPR